MKRIIGLACGFEYLRETEMSVRVKHIQGDRPTIRCLGARAIIRCLKDVAEHIVCLSGWIDGHGSLILDLRVLQSFRALKKFSIVIMSADRQRRNSRRDTVLPFCFGGAVHSSQRFSEI